MKLPHLRGATLLLNLAFGCLGTLAQNVDAKVAHSLYNRVRVIDERVDTAGTAPASVFQDYFSGLVADLTDPNAGTGELLLQLRSWSVHNVGTGISRKGINWIRIVIYAPVAEDVRRYRLLASLDTVIEIPNGFFKGSLHKRLSSAADHALAVFFEGYLGREPSADEPVVDVANIRYIDRVMKQWLPAYAADTLREGVYRSWQSWSMQQPEGDTSSYDPRTTYVLVKGGKAYLFLPSGYVPLVKRGDNFYYIGKLRMYSATASELASLASMAACIAGVPFLSVWTIYKKKDFWMRMDPVSGHFAADREVKKGEL